MNKAEMIKKIALSTALRNNDVRAVIDAIEPLITASLKAGVSVRLGALGSFGVSIVARHIGSNPKTGNPMVILKRKAVRYKASTKIKTELN